MEDQFDEELRNRIRKVFDEHDDPSAGEGWALLRKKFPEKSGRRAIIWIWWAAAALLLLFIGLGLWRYQGAYKPGLAAVNTAKSAKSRDLIAATPGQPPASAHSPQSAQVQSHAAKSPQNQSLNYAATLAQSRSRSSTLSQNPQVTTPAAPGAKAPAAIANDGPIAAVNNAPSALYAGKASDSVKKPATIAATPPAYIAQNPAVQPARPAVHKADSPKKQRPSMFADNTPVIRKTSAGSPLIKLGVYAATYVSYANGSSNQGNLGAGFTAELRLTKHLKLVSGLGIAHNSLIFNSSIPTGVGQNTVLPTYSSFELAPAPSAASAFSVKQQVTIASVPAFKNYSASIYGIDVPVNLKYDFTSRLYLMGGFSSGTYIDESYTYRYNYPAVLSPSLQQIQNQTSRQSFNSYYFGKVVNLAFGFGYPLGRNNLIIEPFVKYPMDGLGTQDIRFGSGGINLKFNFPSGLK